MGRRLTAPPSGEQIELHFGEQRAVVVEVGGGLRCYEVGERAVLDGYREDQICSGGRGQPLIPWPNRVCDGRYEWDGQAFQLDISEPALANAIHGLLRWRNWTVRERSATRVVMAHVLRPSSGYPFALELSLDYTLDEGGLTVAAQATNVGATDCPFGVGFHPYLIPPGTELVDDCLLSLPAATRLNADARSIPRSREPVADTPYDFSSSQRIGDLVLDSCFTDLGRDADGLARVVLESQIGGERTELWLDAGYPFVMLFSGDTLTGAERRRGLAVEPMSCAPNAFQSGDGLVRLEAGETHVALWGVAAV